MFQNSGCDKQILAKSIHDWHIPLRSVRKMESRSTQFMKRNCRKQATNTISLSGFCPAGAVKWKKIAGIKEFWHTSR